MSFQFTLQKVMEIKEREKNESQSKYEAAVNMFEDVATKLYELLKNKEELEEKARQQVEKGTSIFMLQQTEEVLLRIQEQIQVQQHATDRARDNMNKKQQELVHKSIEYKKYEKIKELEKEKFEEEMKRLELIQMDEISTQIYAKRETG